MVNTRKGFKLTPTNKDKRIEELEKDLNYQKQARAIAEKAVMDLEKENAELKKKCYKKAVKDYCELEQEVKYQTEDSKKWQNMYKQRCEECQKLERVNAELKKNYEDSLVTCGVLKKKVELLAQPSPLESMQDVLIATQKAQNEKQSDQLIKAKEIIKKFLSLRHDCKEKDCPCESLICETIDERAEQFLKENGGKK